MSSLLCLVALLSSATQPAALEELRVESEERETTVRIALRGAPSFSTSEGPGFFILDFVGAKSLLPEREESEAPGLIAIRSEEREEGPRVRLLLEPWAQAELRMEEGALAIRIFARPGMEDPAEAMGAAMESLASQMARVGEEVRELSGSLGEEASEEAAEALPRDTVAEAAEAPSPEPAAEAEGFAEEAPSEAPALAAADPTPEEVSPAEADDGIERVEKGEARSSAPSAVSAAVASISAEMVRLGFRPTPTGAMVFVALEGESAHRLEQRGDLVILELAGTRVRRANDKLPLDASFFGTPVGRIRAVEDREAAVTRIEIELLRPAQITVDRLENEISVALAEPASP